VAKSFFLASIFFFSVWFTAVRPAEGLSLSKSVTRPGAHTEGGPPSRRARSRADGKMRRFFSFLAGFSGTCKGSEPFFVGGLPLLLLFLRGQAGRTVTVLFVHGTLWRESKSCSLSPGAERLFFFLAHRAGLGPFSPSSPESFLSFPPLFAISPRGESSFPPPVVLFFSILLQRRSLLLPRSSPPFLFPRARGPAD